MTEYEEQKKADEKAGIIEINEDLLKQLKDMGFDEIGSKKSLIATNNDFQNACDYYLAHSEEANFNTDIHNTHINNNNSNNKPSSSSSSSSSVVSNTVVDVTKPTTTTATTTATGTGAKGKQGKKKKPRYIPLELQRLFTQLQHLDQCAISTEG